MIYVIKGAIYIHKYNYIDYREKIYKATKKLIKKQVDYWGKLAVTSPQ